MLKTLLITTALIVLPFAAMAQDAPAPAPEAPEVATAADLDHAIAKICLVPVSDKLGDSLAKDFSLAYAWDTPLGTEAFVRSSIYEEKDGDAQGMKGVIELSTFIKNGEIINQCVSSLGTYSTSGVEHMKKQWAEHPVGATTLKPPLTDTPKAGTVPTPSFQANPDE
jgi:hypothetical protein